jgi:hypothetical protein
VAQRVQVGSGFGVQTGTASRLRSAEGDPALNILQVPGEDLEAGIGVCLVARDDLGAGLQGVYTDAAMGR